MIGLKKQFRSSMGFIVQHSEKTTLDQVAFCDAFFLAMDRDTL
jgi:hypothetical protein